MARVAVAAVYHETNTFAAARTDERAFRTKGWYEGSSLLAAYAGTRTVVGGFVDGLTVRGHSPAGAFGAFATPSGLVTHAALRSLTAALAAGLEQAEPFDAVLLELHGAQVAEGDHDPESGLCRLVRHAAGRRPVVAVTDLHANMTTGRLDPLDLLVGYRTNPHVDTWETGARAAGHIDRLLAGGDRPTMAVASAPVIAPAIAQSTAANPLARLLDRARELERRAGLLEVTVHGGYAYADVAHAGVAVTVATTGDPVVAVTAAEDVATLAWTHRDEFRVPLVPPVEAVRHALDMPGPVAIADTGDNINGGAPGDGVELVLAVLAHPGVRAAGTLVDPATVSAATAAGVGGLVAAPGGLGAVEWVGPAQVVHLSSGEFTNEGPMARGARTSMGPVASVRVGGVDIVVQSRPVQPNDPALFRCAGVRPEAFDLLLLKGAAALRAGWVDVVGGFVDAATSGVTDSDLQRLPYRFLAGSVWPLTEPDPQIQGRIAAPATKG
jgi:microcystin degradation protein MlrC